MAQFDGSGRDAYVSDLPGETKPGVVPVFHVKAAGDASKGAVLALDAVASTGVITTVFLWASSDGKVRTATTLPTNTETGGTVVGAQS